MPNYASRWSAVGCMNSTTKKALTRAGLLMEVARHPWTRDFEAGTSLFSAGNGTSEEQGTCAKSRKLPNSSERRRAAPFRGSNDLDARRVGQDAASLNHNVDFARA